MSTASTTPDQYPKFPHLENLHRVPFVLEAERIVVTEKVHGFNARFGRTVDDTFWVGSRNNVVYTAKTVDGEGDTVTGDPNSLQGFTRWATRSRWNLPKGYTFYGEWAGTGIQKGISYGTPDFHLFAMLDEFGWLPWGLVQWWGAELGFNVVPTLYEGPHPGVEKLEELRIGQSKLALENREGIVIWGWNGDDPVVDGHGHVTIAKFKAPDFEERAHARRGERQAPDITNIKAFVDDYATEERLNHVFGQLGELHGEGIDPLDRRYLGDVLRLYHADVTREGADDFAKLTKDEQKMLGKVLNPAVKAMLDARAAVRLAA